jgi:hypothetical protein
MASCATAAAAAASELIFVDCFNQIETQNHLHQQVLDFTNKIRRYEGAIVSLESRPSQNNDVDGDSDSEIGVKNCAGSLFSYSWLDRS